MLQAAWSYVQPTSEESNCGAQPNHPKCPPLSREGGSDSGRLHSTGKSVLFMWTIRKRCVLDTRAVPAMQEGFSYWCWLILDHILAGKLCSASLSRQRITEVKGIYHSLYNCSKVRYDHTATLGPCHLFCYQSGLFSWSVFFLDSYSQVSISCCCPPKQW